MTHFGFTSLDMKHTYQSVPQLSWFNPLKAELNSICHLLELLGNHHIIHVSRI